ncbi:hypothetical protein D3C73_1239340 [compost metagenome]
MKCSIITAFSHQEEQWNEEKQHYYRELIRQVDYYGAVSKEKYIGSWQFIARDELLFRKTEGILLVYDEDAGEASPKYFKQRAFKKQANEQYDVYTIGSEEIQFLADEDHSNSEVFYE